jgi:hypothetical protein
MYLKYILARITNILCKPFIHHALLSSFFVLASNSY